LGQPAAPAVPLGTLDRDPGDPAAALTDGGVRGLWEIFAPRYDLRTSAGQWNKDLAAAEIVQPETVDVIFGEAGRREDQVVFGAGESFQCSAGKSAHAIRWNEASHQLARGHVLELPFRGLIAVIKE
jgi:hypothetical protein